VIDGDIIVNALDDDGARMEAQILAARYLKPLLDLGAGIHLDAARAVRTMGGQVIFYVPGGPCLLCQGLDPSGIVSEEIRGVHRAVGYVQGTNETPASVVTINAVIAGIGMDILTRYLTGFAPAQAYLQYDFLKHASRELRFRKRPDCPICGETGIEGKGDEIEEGIPSGQIDNAIPTNRSDPQENGVTAVEEGHASSTL
jgi:hypothetical protein